MQHDSSALLRELDESNRFVEKSAESTSIWPRWRVLKFGGDPPNQRLISTQVVLCHGVCLSLIFSRNVGFQVLYVCTNAGLSVAVGRAAGANALDHYLAPLLAWAASAAGGNAFIFAVLKPTWVKAQRAGNPALERRVDELSREKARVAWEWQLDVARLDRDPEPGAVALPDAPDGTFLPKDAGGVALEGSPESLGDVDLGF